MRTRCLAVQRKEYKSANCLRQNWGYSLVTHHVLRPLLGCGSEVLEQMSKTIATASTAHGIRHERPDDCPSGPQACGHTSICNDSTHVNTFIRSDFSVAADLPSSSAITMPRATRL